MSKGRSQKAQNHAKANTASHGQNQQNSSNTVVVTELHSQPA